MCDDRQVKWCPRCRQILPIESFGPNGARGTGQSYCRPCIRVYCREHYKRNWKRHNKRRMANQRRYNEANRTRAAAYLREHPCVDCGEGDPLVLDFDHVRGEKSYDISVMLTRGCSWRRIEMEIAKCEVRCANCHRRRTAVQFGWWRSRLGA